ncbi:hypothetical protein DFS34DRAFT_419046 [Phlyctochytrium arcticum]|nr:hypothetical protein DFS34DRAFT_419046 [Phlyctochytrium arcticum]
MRLPPSSKLSEDLTDCLMIPPFLPVLCPNMVFPRIVSFGLFFAFKDYLTLPESSDDCFCTFPCPFNYLFFLYTPALVIIPFANVPRPSSSFCSSFFIIFAVLFICSICLAN